MVVNLGSLGDSVVDSPPESLLTLLKFNRLDTFVYRRVVRKVTLRRLPKRLGFLKTVGSKWESYPVGSRM